MGFAAGWTPCTGPILSAVITLASNKPESAVTYMIAYVLGFAIPFLFFPFSSQNGLDQKASAAHHENWRDYYDRSRDLAVL